MVPLPVLDRGTIAALLAASKDAAARDAEVLPRLDAVVITASELTHTLSQAAEIDEAAVEDLSQALRVLRNACAAGPDATAQLFALGLAELIAAAIDVVTCGSAGLNWALPGVTAQLLANAACGGPACAAACWQALFPGRLLTLTHVDTQQAQQAIALALLTLCKGVDGAVEGLAGPQGASLLAAMLHAAHRAAGRGEGNENLGLLLAHLAFERDLLEAAFTSLATVEQNSEAAGSSHRAESGESGGSGNAAGPAADAAQLTAAHAYLLQELGAEAHDAPQSTEIAEKGTKTAKGGAAMAFLLQLVARLAAPGAQPPTPAQQQVLQDVLRLLRDLAARDDGGATLAAGRSLVDELQAAGLTASLLAMLKALGPIINHRRDAPAVPVAELAPGLQARAEQFAAVQPYPGYRSDVLAALANAAHGRPAVQAAVSALGGVELVLAQCQVDDASPLAREWGLWAVRNLCEGSDAAREAIRELRACAAVDSEELRQAGVRVSVDEGTGKLKVGPREGGAAGGAS